MPSRVWLVSIFFAFSPAFALALVSPTFADASPGPHSEIAHSGSWQANFSYVQLPGAFPSFRSLHLRVSQLGQVILDEPVSSAQAAAGQLWPGGFQGHPSLAFVELDGDTTPELVLHLYTGGAHCCFLDQFFTFAGGVRKVERNFGNAGESITRTAGKTLIVSGDNRFAYTFTDYADSAWPIQTWTLRNGRLVDVTRQFPSLIRRDAGRLWAGYMKGVATKGDVRGVAAAWAADEAMLGQAAHTKAVLLDAAFKGYLDVGSAGAKGSSYVRNLWSFLSKLGYLR